MRSSLGQVDGDPSPRKPPDVSLIVDLDDTDVLDRYFSSLLIPAKDGGFPASAIEVVRPPPVVTLMPDVCGEKAPVIARETVEFW
jgi:hypothetical protein